MKENSDWCIITSKSLVDDKHFRKPLQTTNRTKIITTTRDLQVTRRILFIVSDAFPSLNMTSAIKKDNSRIICTVYVSTFSTIKIHPRYFNCVHPHRMTLLPLHFKISHGVAKFQILSRLTRVPSSTCGESPNILLPLFSRYIFFQCPIFHKNPAS